MFLSNAILNFLLCIMFLTSFRLIIVKRFIVIIIVNSIIPVKNEKFFPMIIVRDIVPAPIMNGRAISDARSSKFSFMCISAFCPFTMK